MSNSTSRPTCQRLLHRRARRAVEIAVDLRPFQQLAARRACSSNCSLARRSDSGRRRPRSARRGARRDRDRQADARAPAPSRLRVSVVLPAPEGEDSTSIRPRRAMRRVMSLASFDVLHLLAQLVDHGLQLEADRGQRAVVGLGAERVGLAVEFLRQEVEPAADRRAARRAARAPRRCGRGAGRSPRGCRRGWPAAPPPDAAGPDRAPAPRRGAPRPARRAARGSPPACAPERPRRRAPGARFRRAARPGPPRWRRLRARAWRRARRPPASRSATTVGGEGWRASPRRARCRRSRRTPRIARMPSSVGGAAVTVPPTRCHGGNHLGQHVLVDAHAVAPASCWTARPACTLPRDQTRAESLARAGLDVVEARRQAQADVEALAVDAAHLPRPAIAFPCPVGAGKAGHAAKRHRGRPSQNRPRRMSAPSGAYEPPDAAGSRAGALRDYWVGRRRRRRRGKRRRTGCRRCRWRRRRWPSGACRLRRLLHRRRRSLALRSRQRATLRRCSS